MVIKENVIVGRLVPAGTGSIKNKWNKKALDDDQIQVMVKTILEGGIK